MDFIQSKGLVAEVLPHQRSYDDADILLTEHHHVFACETLYIGNLDTDRRFHLFEFKLVTGLNLHYRRSNVYLCAKQCGNRCCRCAETDVHDLAYGIYFHFVKAASAHFYVSFCPTLFSNLKRLLRHQLHCVQCRDIRIIGSGR